jgi:hypothetical protein
MFTALTADSRQQRGAGLAVEPVCAAVHAPPLLSKPCRTQSFRQYKSAGDTPKHKIQCKLVQWLGYNGCNCSPATAQQALQDKQGCIPGAYKTFSSTLCTQHRSTLLYMRLHCSASPAGHKVEGSTSHLAVHQHVSYNTSLCLFPGSTMAATASQPLLSKPCRTQRGASQVSTEMKCVPGSHTSFSRTLCLQHQSALLYMRLHCSAKPAGHTAAGSTSHLAVHQHRYKAI